MISQLARLFRISLSKGRTVISIKDELQHAQSYMNIQKVRYKNSFSVTFDVDEELYSYCTVKLILQPLLENAINYGVSGIEDCGEIVVTGRLQEDKIVLAVCDNGLGMPEEEAALCINGQQSCSQTWLRCGISQCQQSYSDCFREGIRTFWWKVSRMREQEFLSVFRQCLIRRKIVKYWKKVILSRVQGKSNEEG